MQRAVHQQVGVVVGHRQAHLGGFAFHHRGAQHQVGHHHRLMLVVEGEHVGGVVALAVLAVQRLAFIGIDDAHRDLGRALQRGAQPAHHAVARQVGAVARIGLLQRQVQFHRHRHPPLRTPSAS